MVSESEGSSNISSHDNVNNNNRDLEDSQLIYHIHMLKTCELLDELMSTNQKALF